MEDDILTRQEQTEFIIRLIEVFYSAHVHAGRPYLSMAEAASMAATAVGLAQSDALHARIAMARASPELHIQYLDASARTLNADIAADQEQRAMRFAEALSSKELPP